jgi:hypothetical protein
MRRLLLVLLTAAMAAALLLPAVASAGTGSWNVRNKAGVKIGTITQVGKQHCVLRDKHGRRCGDVAWRKDVQKYEVVMAYAGDTGVSKLAYVDEMGGSGWQILNHDTLKQIGYTNPVHSKWVVSRTRTDVVQGSVIDACPGWGASGAVYVLRLNWIK